MERSFTPKHGNQGGILWILAAMLAVTQARLSVMYTREKLSDLAAEQCLSEMYPKGRKVEIQESDEPCIIFCVMKKIGIMNSNGALNMDIYRQRVQLAQRIESRNSISDYGGSCVETAEATQHKQDVCKKAKAFNDCTHLYRLVFTKR